MKRCLIIVLVVQIGTVPIFSGGVLGELFKLKTIAEHFQVHQQLEHGISFLEFIAMHYGESTAHRGTHNHHESFPFQKCCSGVFVLLAILPAPNDITDDRSFESAQVFYSLSLENRIESFNGEIWLPPKLG